MYGSFSFGPRDQKFRRFILREWNFRPLKVEGGGKVPSSSPFDARSPIFHIEIMLQFHGDFHHLENQVQCFVWIYYFGQVYYFWDPFIQSAGGVRLGRSCGRQVFTSLLRGALFRLKPSRLKWQEFRAIIRSLELKIDRRDPRVKGFEQPKTWT